ncbi:MAG: hypothetical protein DRJ35_02880 [Thermoprotei archaeon]|nr:MAG: hypothetical protein DRJ35_02880 [Thermoprotei archaeon]
MKLVRFILVWAFIVTVVAIILGWMEVLDYPFKPNLWLLGGSFILAGLIAFVVSREAKQDAKKS